METFRHIRENHLTEIKKLNIKIGKPPEPTVKKLFRKPGPRSRTRLITQPVVKLGQLSETGHTDNSDQVTGDTDQMSGMEVDMSEGGCQQVEQMDFESAINSIQQFSEDQRN